MGETWSGLTVAGWATAGAVTAAPWGSRGERRLSVGVAGEGKGVRVAIGIQRFVSRSAEGRRGWGWMGMKAREGVRRRARARTCGEVVDSMVSLVGGSVQLIALCGRAKAERRCS